MKELGQFTMIPLLAMSGISFPTALHAQLLTQGGAGSIYQQFDNSSVNPLNWTRTLGVGYFNTGNPGPTTPLSFLHVYNEWVPLPMNMSIPDLSESFRTTVPAGQNQNWRMERGQVEIGRIYHTNPNNSFSIMAVQPATAITPAAHLFLLNNHENGLKVAADYEVAVNTTVNGFPVLSSGYVATGPRVLGFNALTPAAPWSRSHLAHEVQGANPPNFGFRPQMRNGISFSGNSDLHYVGQWYDQGSTGTDPETDENSNLVIATSEEALPVGFAHKYDNISFRYFGTLAAGGAPDETVEGLEMMLIQPYKASSNDPIEGNVGIGNFLSSVNGPTERLHLLDGHLRIEDLPTDPFDNSLTKIMAVDNTGVVRWREASSLTGQTDCDWFIDPVNKKLVTAWTGANTCGDDDWRLAIGTDQPGSAKMTVNMDATYSIAQGIDVKVTLPVGGSGTGLYAKAFSQSGQQAGSTVAGLQAVGENASTSTYGILTSATMDAGLTSQYAYGTNSGATNHGVLTALYGTHSKTLGSGVALNEFGTYSWAASNMVGGIKHGLFAYVSNGQPATSYGVRTQVITGTTTRYGLHSVVYTTGAVTSYGLYAEAKNATTNYGVYAKVLGNGNSGGGAGYDYAGYFYGDVWVRGTGWSNNGTVVFSDGALKQNIADLTDATSILDQLQPRTYDFNTFDNPQLGLPTAPQMGLIAQEVADVLPDLVHETTAPAELDTLGNVIHPAMQVLGLSYEQFVPLLIAGWKEQRAVNQEQAVMLDQILQDLAICCTTTGDGTFGMQQQGGGNEDENTTVDGIAKNDNRLTIVPNPFQEQTTLSYLLDAAAMVQLQVTTELGLHLATLRQQQQEAGAYSMTWNTQDLAPGVYYVSLYADGAPIVKKAVKVK